MRRLLLALALLPLIVSPAYAADVFGKQPVRTVAIGDVTIEIAGSDGVSVAQIAANNGAAAGNGIFILGGTYNSSLPTNTSGRSVSLQTDVNGRLIVTQDASAGPLTNNLTRVGGSSIVLGQTTMGSSLPVVISSDQTALPANIKQINGSTLSLGQTTMSSSLPVTLASNQGAISTTVGAPSGSSFIRNAATNIAAAGSSTIVVKSALAVSTPTKPLQFTVTASDQVRCTLQYNDNSTLTKFTDVTVSPAAPTFAWQPPSGIVGLTTSSTSTTQQYEAVCSNFGSTAQDVYVSLVYCSAASGC